MIPFSVCHAAAEIITVARTCQQICNAKQGLPKACRRPEKPFPQVTKDPLNIRGKDV